MTTRGAVAFGAWGLKHGGTLRPTQRSAVFQLRALTRYLGGGWGRGRGEGTQETDPQGSESVPGPPLGAASYSLSRSRVRFPRSRLIRFPIDFGSFLDHFWTIFGSDCPSESIDFGSFLYHFWVILGAASRIESIDFAYFLDHFSVILGSVSRLESTDSALFLDNFRVY